LRTLSGVKHINLTNETEYIIIDINVLKLKDWNTSGFTDRARLHRAMQDIRNTSYRNRVIIILVVRRGARLESKNRYLTV